MTLLERDGFTARGGDSREDKSYWLLGYALKEGERGAGLVPILAYASRMYAQGAMLELSGDFDPVRDIVDWEKCAMAFQPPIPWSLETFPDNAAEVRRWAGMVV